MSSLRTAPKVADFEGMIYKTARMFASQVKMEEEDLRQELRVIAWKAMRSHRGDGSLKGYVFWCMTNKIKDYKRNAARRAEYDVRIGYIESYRSGGEGQSEDLTLDWFEMHYACETHEHAYGRIEEGLLVLPATLTADESKLVVLLTMGLSERESAMRLGIKRADAFALLASAQAKLADWRPNGQAAQVVSLDAVAA